MSLFENQVITEVVTPKNIKDLTGIKPSDYQFNDTEEDPNVLLDELLEEWITRIGSHVHSRLKRSITEEDDEYDAIRDIIIRTVAKVVAVSQQQRTTPIVQTSDFAVNILDTSEVIKGLRQEIAPFKRRRISVFSSIQDYEEEGS